jgi:hypothetical protein
MKGPREIKEIMNSEAPLAEFGSYLAGYRAAERRMCPLLEVRWAIVLGTLCGFALGLALHR